MGVISVEWLHGAGASAKRVAGLLRGTAGELGFATLQRQESKTR